MSSETKGPIHHSAKIFVLLDYRETLVGLVVGHGDCLAIGPHWYLQYAALSLVDGHAVLRCPSINYLY